MDGGALIVTPQGSDNTLQLIAIQFRQQARGHRYRGPFRFEPHGKSVGYRRIDQIDARHRGKPGGNLHFLNNVKQSRIIVPLNLPSARGGQEDFLSARHGGQHRYQSDHQGNGHADVRPFGLRENGKPNTTAEHPEHRGQQHNKHGRLAPVRMNDFPHFPGEEGTERLELDLGHFALFRYFDLEELGELEAKKIGHDVRGYTFDPGVVLQHLVVPSAGGKSQPCFPWTLAPPEAP